jgi:hypothetical protein
MADVTYHSISTATISTGTITADSVYARILTGDGASLSNLNFSNFATPIPRSSYAAYTIPWNAMERDGSITLDSATWLVNGLMAVNSMSVATSLTTNTFRALNGDIAALTSPVICTFYMSANSLTVNTSYFKSSMGAYINASTATITSLFTSSVTASGFDVDNFYAQSANFSTLSTGTWQANTVELKQINLYDQSTNKFAPITLSANTLYLNNSTILSNVVSAEQLASTVYQVAVNAFIMSNALYPHRALSSLSSSVESNLSITQIAVSSVSAFAGAASNFAVTSTSNLSTSVDAQFITLSNYTFNTMSNISTASGIHLSNHEDSNATDFLNTSNVFQAAVSSLSTGYNLDLSNLSVNTITTISNISTAQGADSITLHEGISSVGLFLTAGLSTLSTTIGSNHSSIRYDMSTAISNLSVSTDIEFGLSKVYLSTTASNMSTIWGSLFSTLVLSGVLSSVSSFSTVMGADLADIRGGISTSSSNLSTTAGSNFSASRIALSTLSTTFGSNFSTSQLGLSTLSTTIGSNFSTSSYLMLSSVSSLSTTIGLNYETLQATASTLSTTTGSNFSTSSYLMLSSVSSLSTTIGLNYETLGAAASTLSTTIGSNHSSLTESLLSTISINNYFTSTLQLAASSLSTAAAVESSTIRTALSTLSTNGGSNFSVSLIGLSTLSTTIGSFSNMFLNSASSLSTTIGQTSNYLAFFSTTSSMIGSTFSTLALGLSSISTTIGLTAEATAIGFSTQNAFITNLSSGSITAGIMNASTVFISTGFFSQLQGSTMSSLTQQTGYITAHQIATSSFSGNLADATTIIIQRI